ncbi:MAG: PAS domain S-box protein [Candidatus Thermoplasmatota archaeon]
MIIKILLVDDDTAYLEHCKDLLERIDDDFEVHTATSAQRGLKLLDQGSYDVVVSDYRMPDKDGLSFLKDVREKGIDVPFIVFTIVPKDEVAKEAYDLGADNFLEKDENLKDRIGTLSSVIRKEVDDHRTKNKYEDLINDSTDLIAEIDEDGRFLHANPALRERFGSGKDELKGKDVFEIFPGEVAEKIMEKGRKALESGEKRELEHRMDDGWFNSLFVPTGEKLEEESFHVVVRDITHRKEIERKLQKREEKYRDLVEESIVGIYIIQEGVFKYVNPEFCRMLGYDREELLGKNYLDVVGSEDEDFVKKSVEKREKEGGLSRHVFKGSTKEGEEKFFEAHSVSTHYEGEPAIQGTLLDVSTRKEAQRKLKKSQKRFKNLFQLTPDLVFMINSDGVFENINDTFLKLTGYEEEEIIGEHYEYLSFFTDEAVEKLDERLQVGKEKEGCPFSFTIQPRDETIKFLEVNMEDLKEDGDVVGWICIARDITERKRLEDLSNGLLRSREVGVTVIKDDKIVETNSYFEEISGYSREEVLGKNVSEFIPSEEREEVSRNATEMLRGERMEPYEHRFLDKRGNEGWVLEQVSPIHYEGERALLATFVDITEKKEVEERQEFLHSLLRHDIMNKNQVAQGYLQLMEERELDPDVEKFVEKALSTIKGSSELIEKVRKLRDLDKEQETKEQNLDILLKTTIEKKRIAAEESGIEIVYDGIDTRVNGGDLMKEVFSNLIENSIQHSEGDKIKISVEEAETSVTASIEDDGKGIPDKEKERIFERGYKGKDSSGSGLGMHLVKKIIDSYGGEIEITDSDLGGARFDVKLRKAS